MHQALRVCKKNEKFIREWVPKYVLSDLTSIKDFNSRLYFLNELIRENVVKPMQSRQKLSLVTLLGQWSSDKCRRMERLLQLPYYESICQLSHGNEARQSMFNRIDLSSINTNKIRLDMSVHIDSLHHIDTVNQQFEMRMEIDLRLPVPVGKQVLLQSGDALSPTNWEPWLVCVNMIDCRSWTMRSSIIRQDRYKSIRYLYTIDGSFSETLELNWFPFDDQQMCTKLKLGRSDATLVPTPDSSHIFHVSNFSEDNVWKLTYKKEPKSPVDFSSECVWVTNRCSLSPTRKKTNVIPEGAQRSDIVKVSVLLQRKPMYYIWNIYLPMSFLTLMTASNIVIPICSVADRLSVNLTLILTAVAYKFIAAQDLPNVAYLTFLDVHVLVCFVSLFVSVLETIIFAGLSHSCEELLPWNTAMVSNATHTFIDNLNHYSVYVSVINLLSFVIFNIGCVLFATVIVQRKHRKHIRQLQA